MTKRVLKGLSHPKAKILAHPTGRKIGLREGYELDWEAIFEFCRKNGKALEISAWPDRLDLPDTLVREAVKAGVKLVIDSDSHAADQMTFMRFGVAVARRGWAEKKDVLNTLPREKLNDILLR
jgi:DNA polymerase (family 10)